MSSIYLWLSDPAEVDPGRPTREPGRDVSLPTGLHHQHHGASQLSLRGRLRQTLSRKR